jgi:hypothetical protein
LTERKAAKNRLHLDIGVSGGRAVPIETRRQRVDAEAARPTPSGRVACLTFMTYSRSGAGHRRYGPRWHGTPATVRSAVSPANNSSTA